MRDPGPDGTASPTGPVRKPGSARRLVAIYLGSRTIVLGAGGVTFHRHTRATLDRNAAIIGFARSGRSSVVRRMPAHVRGLESGR